MTQNKEWLWNRLRSAGIPEGTGEHTHYEAAKKLLVGEAIGRGDQRIWDKLQEAVREYIKLKEG